MPDPNDHASHDTFLIAAHAAGDLTGAQVVLADRLLASCGDCARLHADLRAIAAATHALPAAATAATPRDFRITPEQAARLRRGNLLRRILRPFAGPTSRARPLAVTFSGLGAIGIAIVLLAPVLGGATVLAPLAGSSGTERDAFSGAGAAATAAPATAAPAPAAPTTMATHDELQPGGAVAEASPAAPRDAASGTAQPVERPAAPEGKNGDETGGTGVPNVVTAERGSAPLLLLGSVVLLAVGLGLFALRILARRIA